MKDLRDSAIDIFLQPGEFYFADEPCCIRTILGSCVAITMWHPRLKIGGMGHCMLPSRKGNSDTLSAKYEDEAMQMFEQQARHHNTRLREYQIKLFGGANMFPAAGDKPLQIDIARENIDYIHKLLVHYNLKFTAEDVGQTGHRNIIFDVRTGNVWVKHSELTERQTSG